MLCTLCAYEHLPDKKSFLRMQHLIVAKIKVSTNDNVSKYTYELW